MTSESSGSDIQTPESRSINCRRINSNQIMLDLRHQVQHQDHIIRSLIAERDSLTRELDSRLFLVEAQLRREQKHIEAVLGEKEELIQFQALQIHSLKQLLSEVSQNQIPYQRSCRSSRRSLSKRYSVALDEYMKDHCIVSRALPVMVDGENEAQMIKHTTCNRTRSLPELRFKEMISNQESYQQGQNLFINSENMIPHQQWCHHLTKPLHKGKGDTAMKICCRTLSHDILDEISNKKWTSDCDSEHSDSLDSGISSPSIKSKSIHEDFGTSIQDFFAENEVKQFNANGNSSIAESNTSIHNFEPEYGNNNILAGGNHKPRRSSSIGNFINRTFSSSSSQEKIKGNHDTTARRHSSFSDAGIKDFDQERAAPRTRLINSTNKTFGTNHRSVTKPRDIKFKKLFKFKRRTEPETVNGEDYMTV